MPMNPPPYIIIYAARGHNGHHAPDISVSCAWLCSHALGHEAVDRAWGQVWLLDDSPVPPAYANSASGRGATKRKEKRLQSVERFNRFHCPYVCRNKSPPMTQYVSAVSGGDYLPRKALVRDRMWWGGIMCSDGSGEC